MRGSTEMEGEGLACSVNADPGMDPFIGIIHSKPAYVSSRRGNKESEFLERTEIW